MSRSWLNDAAQAAASREQAQAFVQQYGGTRYLVQARLSDFSHGWHADGPVATLARLDQLHEFVCSLAPGAEAWILLREGVLGCFEDLPTAFEVACLLSRLRDLPVSMALTGGFVMKGPQGAWFGGPVSQAMLGCGFARPAEVVVPSELIAQISVPRGVGVLSAPEVLEQEMNQSLKLIRDYRTE